jgi:hypothetical protein
VKMHPMACICCDCRLSVTRQTSLCSGHWQRLGVIIIVVSTGIYLQQTNQSRIQCDDSHDFSCGAPWFFCGYPWSFYFDGAPFIFNGAP